MNIKKIFFIVFCLTFGIAGNSFAADEQFLSCGPGYILIDKGTVDGIATYECQKLWCRDLENGKTMGSGSAAATGYKTTSGTNEICDAENNCVECFGDRKWCANETPGVWNPEYGSYTRGGNDSATYSSYQKGGCFAWNLQKPTCDTDESAILKNGEWICVTSTGSTTVTRDSSVRRTGSTVKGFFKK